MSVVMPSTREMPSGPTAGLLQCKAEADDHHEGGGGGGASGSRPLMVNGFLGRRRPGDSSGSSSSIGVPGESYESASEEEEDEAEVESKFRPSGPLRTLGSLEDSLPIKRGLSSHFSGKSKSFASLADVVTKATATAADLAKQENPFNKRRRILMMAKKSQWPRRASCSSLMPDDGSDKDEDDMDESSSTPATASAAARRPPLPLRPLREEDDEESYDDPFSMTSRMGVASPVPPPPAPNRRLSLEGSSGRPLSSSFRSPRSFSLTDLQQHQYANDFH